MKNPALDLINTHLLASIIFKSHADHAFVEGVGARPGEGPTGPFAFGRARGVVEGVLAAAGLPVTFVTPPARKRAVGLTLAPKDASRAELFVHVKDDGRAEACLIGAAGLMRKGGEPRAPKTNERRSALNGLANLMTAHVVDFSKNLRGHSSRAAIREGFTDGRLNAAMHGSRASTKAIATEPFSKRKWHKMIDRPPYVTEEEFNNAKREAKEQKTKERKTRCKRGEADAVSEDSLALAFVDRHGHELRYVAAWGKWLKWTGTHWQIEKTLAVFDKARKICREAGMKKAKTVAAIEMLSRSDRRVAAIVEQWDADSWALNTPGGIVDLKSGRLRPHDPCDYATKITAAAPIGKCPCPLFMALLEKIFGGDKQVIGYMQKVFGYALTGVTIEHAMMFFYGTGANGKSVLVATMSGILGTYHRAASIETFTASNIPRHTADLAALMGARLVTAVETEEGRHWAESKIKTLTGGDKISAQFTRQDYFDFSPAFKLVI